MCSGEALTSSISLRTSLNDSSTFDLTSVGILFTNWTISSNFSIMRAAVLSVKDGVVISVDFFLSSSAMTFLSWAMPSDERASSFPPLRCRGSLGTTSSWTAPCMRGDMTILVPRRVQGEQVSGTSVVCREQKCCARAAHLAGGPSEHSLRGFVRVLHNFFAGPSGLVVNLHNGMR